MMRWLHVAAFASLALGPLADQAACPADLTLMARLNYSAPGSAGPLELAACEDLRSADGSVLFVGGAEAGRPWPLLLRKRVASNRPLGNNDTSYLGFSKEEVLQSGSDLLGNFLLGIHGHPRRPSEPTLAEVAAAVPPLRSITSARVWTANRESGKDATFDERAANPTGGTPDPRHVDRLLPGKRSAAFEAEGLLGGGLPILLLDFPVEAGYAFWEMSVVPVPNGTGREQPVFIRFLQVNSSAATGKSRPGTMYFNSYEYAPSLGCWNEDFVHPSGCDAPRNYYSAILDVHFYWERTWASEGRMEVSLPARRDTDGDVLQRQASYAFVLDMIVRVAGVWPRYGTDPGYDQPGIGSDGFPEIFTATMMASLEWGMFPYARAVLDNWLTYFIQRRGFLLYRGLEMAQHARMLTIIAQYYRYTGDGDMLRRHLDKISGIAGLLRRRVAEAEAAYPPSDSRHGMPAGNDEADLFWGTTVGYHTELPFISIAAETWRGLRDCGEALLELGGEAAAAGRGMLAAAPGVLAHLRRSMQRDAFDDGGARCHPYAAGFRECGQLPSQYSPRDKEGWRTYPEAMYSGALEDDTIREILAWHQTRQGSGVKGSRLKLGVPAGCGGDMSCTDQLMTFTVHGWGYGLLQADLVEPFLLHYYALSAHAYTRGTWIAPESTHIDRTISSVPFCTAAELTAPILLRWMLVWEHPADRTVWFGKALPRVWLSEGELVSVSGAATSFGRLSIALRSHIASQGLISVNLTLPVHWSRQGVIPAAIQLRLRAPGAPKMQRVTVGGVPWAFFNASTESVAITAADLASPGMLTRLQDIRVGYQQTFVM